MRDSDKNNLSLPPEQQAIRDKCFHPSGTFVEFAMEDVETSIPARFEKIVRLYPDRLAVKDKDRSLTYDQLNRRANRIARTILANRGEGSEPIAILFEHGVDVIVALCAVLKAGKFYVALDLSVPLERNEFILKDSGARLIITNTRNATLAQELSCDARALISIDECDNSISSDNPCLSIARDNFVNIIYTSGSTGRPKAVARTHHNFLDSLAVSTRELRIIPDDRLILLHSVSFGLSHKTLFPSLLNGASLFPFDVKSEGFLHLVEWLIKEQITLWHSTPTLFRHLAESVSGHEKLQSLRLINLAGAPVTQLDFDLYKNKFSSQTLLRVAMSSTEARAICSAFLDHSFSFPKDGVPAGYPVEGKTIFLVDENGIVVGPGQVGEIAVKSRNLAAGYWNQPDLTTAKFLPDPNGGDERIYLTGDLGRMLPDGFLIHLGRKDFIVKIRGYRVEISEIERALLAHPTLTEAGVVAWDQESGEKYLVAYVVPRKGVAPTINELRSFLKEKLPDYMIPSAFMFLESLPLTNGKLDRTALPPPDHGRPALQQPYAAPNGEVETRLVQIWEEILNVRPVGIHDNFYDLGAHSLMAVRLVSEIETKLGKCISVATLMQGPTVAQLASVLSEQEKFSQSPLITIHPSGSKPPFFCAHGTDSYLQLSRYFGSDQPFYGLAQHLEGRKVRHTSIEDIAAHYLKEVRRVQPEGPYYMGGHSLGGVIALEMAQQLKKQNQEIELLVLLDSGLPRTHPSETTPKIGNFSRCSRQEIRKQLWIFRHWLKEACQKKFKTMVCEVYHCLGMSLPTSLQTYYVDQVVYGNIYSNAHRSYVPQTYAGRVVYLKSEDLRERVSGWEKLIASGLEVHPVPGDHLSMLAEPNLKSLAETLKQCLAKAQENAQSDILSRKESDLAQCDEMRTKVRRDPTAMGV